MQSVNPSIYVIEVINVGKLRRRNSFPVPGILDHSPDSIWSWTRSYITGNPYLYLHGQGICKYKTILVSIAQNPLSSFNRSIAWREGDGVPRMKTNVNEIIFCSLLLVHSNCTTSLFVLCVLLLFLFLDIYLNVSIFLPCLLYFISCERMIACKSCEQEMSM